MNDHVVVVIGAGTAGLSAAARLRRAGRSSAVLEAHDTIRGRARLIRPARLDDAALDGGTA